MISRYDLGYRHGIQFDVELYEVLPGIWLEPVTAASFLIMRTIAALDGIILEPTSGFRSNAKQEEIYLRRDTLEEQKVYGIAAKPGYSNHQTGQCVDIATGLSYGDFAAGKRSSVYTWLLRNAPKFEFTNTVKTEPWHWERK